MSDQKISSEQSIAMVYTAIEEQRYNDAIDILYEEYQNFPRSRAVLSLLGSCAYCIGDYGCAVTYYEQLLQVCPDVEEYKLYYAQSLYKAGELVEASKAVARVDGESFQSRVLTLQAAIKYDEDELPSCKARLDQFKNINPDDPEVELNYAAISYKEGKFELARKQYTEAMNAMGYQSDVALNIALCHYREVCKDE